MCMLHTLYSCLVINIKKVYVCNLAHLCHIFKWPSVYMPVFPFRCIIDILIQTNATL